jgi:hypothetical protein
MPFTYGNGKKKTSVKRWDMTDNEFYIDPEKRGKWNQWLTFDQAMQRAVDEKNGVKKEVKKLPRIALLLIHEKNTKKS